MSYITSVYFPDAFRELLKARPDLNISEICRKAIAEELGFVDVNSLALQIKNHEKTLEVLKKQLQDFNKTVSEPENSMLLSLSKQDGTAKRDLLVSTFGQAALISLVQKNLLMPHPSLNQHMTLTAKGKDKAKVLEGKA